MIDEETYYGYLFVEVDGAHTPSYPLQSIDQIMLFCLAYGEEYPEIRVTDGGGHIVVQMIENMFTYPQEWEAFNHPAMRIKWWTKKYETRSD